MLLSSTFVSESPIEDAACTSASPAGDDEAGSLLTGLVVVTSGISSVPLISVMDEDDDDAGEDGEEGKAVVAVVVHIEAVF